MRDCDTHYEYVAVYSDNIIIASKDPKGIYDKIQEVYLMKGIGEPESFISAEMGRMNGEYIESGSTSTWSAKTYLSNIIARIEKEHGILRAYTCPIDQDYHLDLDESTLLHGDEISIFRMSIRCARWAITFCCMGIVYAMTMLSRYNMAPREGHTVAMKKLCGYLKSHVKVKITFDARPLDVPHATYLESASWTQMNRDIQEELPPGYLQPNIKLIDITVYFDASFACDLIIRDQSLESLCFWGAPLCGGIARNKTQLKRQLMARKLSQGDSEWKRF